MSRATRLRSTDIPSLIRLIEDGDEIEQADVLTLVCPCRNVRYDRELWLAIFRTAASTSSRLVHDRATHAIMTLKKRARFDPRSQELIAWLSSGGVVGADLQEAVPVWRPNPYANLNGLFIPRFERPSRSRSNRRR